jgi:hypothetical protein
MGAPLSSRFPLAAQRGVADAMGFTLIIQAAHRHPIQPGVEREERSLWRELLLRQPLITNLTLTTTTRWQFTSSRRDLPVLTSALLATKFQPSQASKHLLVSPRPRPVSNLQHHHDDFSHNENLSFQLLHTTIASINC